MVVDTADTGTHTEVDTEVDLAAHDGVGGDAYLREESVAPIALHGLGDLGTGHIDHLSDTESGESCQHIVLIAFDTLDGDASDLTAAGHTGIGDVGVDDLVLSR